MQTYQLIRAHHTTYLFSCTTEQNSGIHQRVIAVSRFLCRAVRVRRSVLFQIPPLALRHQHHHLPRPLHVPYSARHHDPNLPLRRCHNTERRVGNRVTWRVTHVCVVLLLKVLFKYYVVVNISMKISGKAQCVCATIA